MTVEVYDSTRSSEQTVGLLRWELYVSLKVN